MEMKVLTGITKPVLNEILEDGKRTIELRSANNIICLQNVSAGNYLLLTNKKHDDVDRGVNGLITKVMKKKDSMHHVSYTSESIYEEKETRITRIKVNLVGLGSIKKIINRDKGILAEIEERIESYSAG